MGVGDWPLLSVSQPAAGGAVAREPVVGLGRRRLRDLAAEPMAQRWGGAGTDLGRHTSPGQHLDRGTHTRGQ